MHWCAQCIVTQDMASLPSHMKSIIVASRGSGLMLTHKGLKSLLFPIAQVSQIRFVLLLHSLHPLACSTDVFLGRAKAQHFLRGLPYRHLGLWFELTTSEDPRW